MNKVFINSNNYVFTDLGVFKIHELDNKNFKDYNGNVISCKKIDKSKLNKENLVKYNLCFRYNTIISDNVNIKVRMGANLTSDINVRGLRVGDKIVTEIKGLDDKKFGKEHLHLAYEKGFYRSQMQGNRYIPKIGYMESLSILGMSLEEAKQKFKKGNFIEFKGKLYNYYDDSYESLDVDYKTITSTKYSKYSIIDYVTGFFEGVGSLKIVDKELRGISVYSISKLDVFEHIYKLAEELGIETRIMQKLDGKLAEGNSKSIKIKNNLTKSYYCITMNKIGLMQLKKLGALFRRLNLTDSKKKDSKYQDYKIKSIQVGATPPENEDMYELSYDNNLLLLINDCLVSNN